LNIAIIDAEIVGKNRHRFPNLVCMKLCAWHKQNGCTVSLKTDYDKLDSFDKVYISKVFTITEIPYEPKDKTDKRCNTIADWYSNNELLKRENVVYGGTGFFYDKSPLLPYEVEHIMPDYHLYDDWIKKCVDSGAKKSEFTYYQDYSIGMATRGCFRKCGFCVNRNCSESLQHSPIKEFLDVRRKKICLQDDNFLACPNWKEILLELQSTGKPFQFKQGLDVKLLTDENCEILFKSKYDGDYIFAFDNIDDSEIIESQIRLLRKYTSKIPKFYVFCGYDRAGKYDEDFWLSDIYSVFQRLNILGKYGCIPYLTRFERCAESPYRKIYVDLARWCNQPAFFKKISFWEFCEKHSEQSGTYKFAREFMRVFIEYEELFCTRWFTLA